MRLASLNKRAYTALEPLAPFVHDIRKKQQVTLSSLRKVEDGTSQLRRSLSRIHDPRAQL